MRAVVTKSCARGLPLPLVVIMMSTQPSTSRIRPPVDDGAPNIHGRARQLRLRRRLATTLCFGGGFSFLFAAFPAERCPRTDG